MTHSDEYLQMSGIQHFAFCRRQWALAYLEQQWAENLRTAEGRLEHARCHDEAFREKRGGLLTVRGMRVVSRRLRLTGACDVVEFRADPAGVPLQGQPGLRGRFLARIAGETRGNVLLRQQQYRAADDPFASCRYARDFLLGKVYNARWVLERATRDHPQRVPVDRLKALSGQLAAALPRIQDAMTAEELRGIEGEAAQRYFDGFDSLILQQRETFAFSGRSRRPPLDPVNALLSFAYTLLARECAAALEGVGLDPYVGFLHRPRPGRTSLALDLMEELRPVCADRFVLSCINQKQLTAKHCQRQESGAVLLTDEGRRAFLTAWQQRRQQTIQHPFLGEKIPWGLVPHVQALLLARTLRGDLDCYPPFFWK